MIEISEVKFSAASRRDVETGLLGFISCVVDGELRLDGITLRRTLRGTLALSFPARRSGSGGHHDYICPVDDSARRNLEGQVFRALALEVAW